MQKSPTYKIARSLILFPFMLWVHTVLASPLLAPPNFDLADGSGRAIFSHFMSAIYDVRFDVATQTTKVKSIINFETDEAGMPLFDMVDEPTKLTLDGVSASQKLINTPHKSNASDDSQLRVILSKINPGIHELIVEHEIKAFGAIFDGTSVQSGFFMSDFEGRGLLERYLPANFEFDQVSMVLNVEVLGSTREELIFTNGIAQSIGSNRWSIQFPGYFNSSAPFFHIRPADVTEVVSYAFSSSDGRTIPVTIYKPTGGAGDNLYDLKTLLNQKLLSYENLFGPFPHPSLTIYSGGMMGTGGMEYAGAAFTDLDSLPHELAHMWFGRGVMAANGNAGWIDEAMATYVGGPNLPNPSNLKPLNMSGHSEYFRANDGHGYFYGTNFLGYLGQQFNLKNSALSMNDFLREWVRLHSREVITASIFETALEHYSGMHLKSLFQTYVYGGNSPSPTSTNSLRP